MVRNLSLLSEYVCVGVKEELVYSVEVPSPQSNTTLDDPLSFVIYPMVNVKFAL